MHLLTRLARDLGATIKPVAGKLLVVPRGESRTATGQLLQPITITPQQIKSFRLTINERGALQTSEGSLV